ncbi:MAG: hypothetical protein J3K34DRAFT_398046 [Monoraphidium minutum]|nr:MAG: hypothetical protein J3K34DRAFT_398046 [Monoraphidium minutum]
MVFGWRESGQQGPLTRVMCCTDDERDAYRERRADLLALVPTHIAPSYAVNAETGDSYPPYNKPGGVMHWLSRADPGADWVLVLDSDMILRRPLGPDDYPALPGPGWASGARYDYLIGVNNALADRHVPRAPRKRDALAGPEGRRADRIGGFYFIHRADLKRIAPLWLKFAEDVRQDPEAWHLSGDFYSKKAGEKPWISEMYGYVFGAASLNISHVWDETSMIYPGYTPTGVPKILHYGLLWHLEHQHGKWSFDKHWFTSFDVTVCPPWEESGSRVHPYGLFPAPPRPSQLKQGLSKAARYRDLISIEVVHTLNAAVCQYHLRHCPLGAQLLSACSGANVAYEETVEAVRAMDEEMACADVNEADCPNWARAGECENNAAFMHMSCRLSCKLCKRASSRRAERPNGLALALLSLGQPSSSAPGGPPPPPPVKRGSSLEYYQEEEEEVEAAAPSASVAAAVPVDTGRRGGGAMSREKQLERRCYKRSELSMQQVKDCMVAARRGVEWQMAEPGSAAGDDQAAANDGGDGWDGASGGGSRGGGEGGAGRGPELRSSRPQSSAGQAAAAAGGGWRAHASMGGALLAWVGIVGMFLSLLPILYRRSKRPKAPANRPPKVNV